MGITVSQTYRVDDENAPSSTTGHRFYDPWASVFIVRHNKVLVLERQQI